MISGGLQNRYSPVRIWSPPPDKIKGLQVF
jgi:hypothetical protein